MPDKILVVDDEVEIADLIEVYLNNENYSVFKFYSAKEALECINTTNLDLVILDVMLPDIDGYTLCQKIRTRHTYPIIMLTAKDGETDKINGLTLGADDYMTKPFSVAILKARLENLLQRNGSRKVKSDREAGEAVLISGSIRLYPGGLKAYREDEALDLSLTEFRLLQYFMENKNRVLLKEQILERIWDDRGNFVEENTLPVNISRLRKKIKENHIRTIHGMGYLWEDGL